MLGLGGCTNDGAKGGAGSTISVGDFNTVGTTAPTPSGGPSVTSRQGVRTIPSSEANEGLVNVEVFAGQPDIEATNPSPLGEAVAVDAIVGEINGKGIRAMEFLEPMGARFTALSREKSVTLGRWRQLVGARIGEEIKARVTDEVLRAEALQSIPPDQRQQIEGQIEFRWRQLVSKNGGSEELAKRALADEGRTYAQWRYDTETSELAIYIIRKKISPRIQVSEHDMRLYYDQNKEQYAPPPRYKFRRISVSPTNPSDAEEIAARLAAGESFETLARSKANTFKADSGGEAFVQTAAPQAQGEFFTIPILNAAARQAEAGKFYGPYDVVFQKQTYKEWIYFEGVERKEIPFVAAQREIEEKLKERRFREEREKLMQDLIEKADVTRLETMGERLVQIAEERYYRPNPDAPGAEAPRGP